MVTQFTVFNKNQDGTFGPTSENHFYKPIIYHSSTAKLNKHKSRWSIDESCQFNVFKIADEHKWCCSINSCLFSIVNNGDIVLGCDGERIAKFPKPMNKTDPWHGFPTTTTKDHISDDLLDKWENDSIITRLIRRRIVRGVI